ncbi:ubiquitin-conjugating enzyme E2 E [Enteropsectra breve]|nr:ubiquitin-conjugating enzyme E2 E [Enteropsectra breve]
MSPALNQSATKRILKELAIMSKEPPQNVSASPIDDSDVYKWQAVILGPAGSLYDGGVFKLSIIFPPGYPFAPPKIEFITRIYHCNILNKLLCLDILKTQWSPALTIDKVLLSIVSLLMDPNPNDPLNREAADKYLNNKDEYDRLAKEWTKRYAMGKHSEEERHEAL